MSEPLDITGYEAPFGMPLIVSPHAPEGKAIIVDGKLLMREGSPTTDRVLYGFKDGHLVGPLRRAEALISRADVMERNCIDLAFNAADLRLFLLQQDCKRRNLRCPLGRVA